MKINIEGNLITTTADSDLHVVISGARGPAGEPGTSAEALYIGNSNDYYATIVQDQVYTFNIETSLAFTTGTYVTLTPTGDPTFNHLCLVQSYSGTTGVIELYVLQNLTGSIASNSWVINLSGPAGPVLPTVWGTITGTLSTQTDLQTALNAKVPYTGATQDVNLGEWGAQLGNIEFDNTPTNIPTTDGSLYWDNTDGTLALRLKGGNVISKIGETQHIRAYNNTGTAIAKGKVVYVTGSQGQRLTVALADADTELLSKDTIGLTAESIADGAEGFVIVQGILTNISTTGFADGDTVFLSQTAGGYTNVAPSDPAHLVILGFVVKGGSGGAGSIYIKVDNGYEIQELHNVIFNGLADKDILQYESSTQLWKNKPKNYTQVLTSGTSFEIALATIGVTVNNVSFFTPSGDEVSVPYRVSDKLYINSNVNLLNHTIKII